MQPAGNRTALGGGREVLDYLEIPLRRPWHVAIPFVLVLAAAVTTSYVLPVKYRSSTLILVESEKVPDSFVGQVATERVGRRLQTVKQEVTSRTRLETVVRELDPYGQLEKTSITDQVEWMRGSDVGHGPGERRVRRGVRARRSPHGPEGGEPPGPALHRGDDAGAEAAGRRGLQLHRAGARGVAKAAGGARGGASEVQGAAHGGPARADERQPVDAPAAAARATADRGQPAVGQRPPRHPREPGPEARDGERRFEDGPHPAPGPARLASLPLHRRAPRRPGRARPDRRAGEECFLQDRRGRAERPARARAGRGEEPARASRRARPADRPLPGARGRRAARGAGHRDPHPGLQQAQRELPGPAEQEARCAARDQARAALAGRPLPDPRPGQPAGDPVLPQPAAVPAVRDRHRVGRGGGSGPRRRSPRPVVPVGARARRGPPLPGARRDPAHRTPAGVGCAGGSAAGRGLPIRGMFGSGGEVTDFLEAKQGASRKRRGSQ